ncbi:MAG: hypothetical protein Q8L48_25305 [Archangium sp.]|nr:hypothetical protein [Archangium sp.]
MTGKEPDEGQKRIVLTGTLVRQRRKAVSFQTAPPPTLPQPPPTRRPAHVARMLALAHHLQRAIDEGLVADRAAVARRLGMTRARVTQLLDLLLLAPDLQALVLQLEAVDGVEPLSEKTVGKVARIRPWGQQRREWATKSSPR